MSAPAILVIEDDQRIGSSLLRALEGSGYDVRWEPSATAGLRSFTEARPDVVLLDLTLPDADGLEVCRELRSRDSSVDIIMLTARGDELDVVIGLDAGAVDYLSKPFRLAELLARIRAQLRRGHDRGAPADPAGIRIDRAARRAWRGGVEVDLRAKEFDLVARLLADAGSVVTREALMSDVWDEHWFGSTKTLDFHIAAVRRKFDDPGLDSRITTVRGVGYRWEAG